MTARAARYYTKIIRRRGADIGVLAVLAGAAIFLGGCSGHPSGSDTSRTTAASKSPTAAATTTQAPATTTTATPLPAEMAAWVVEAKLPLTTLIANLGTLTSELQAVNEVGNPSSDQFLASNTCGSLAAAEGPAGRVSAAPIATVETEWRAVVSTYAGIAAACSSAVDAGDAASALYASLTTLESPFEAAVKKLVTNVEKAGYCFPSETCLPPYTVAP